MASVTVAQTPLEHVLAVLVILVLIVVNLVIATQANAMMAYLVVEIVPATMVRMALRVLKNANVTCLML
jgi:hypothetical protein